MKTRQMAVAAVLMLTGAAALSGASLSFSPPSSTVFRGSTLTLNINAENMIELYAWQFDLEYNPAVLQLQTQVEGSFLSDTGPTLFTPGMVDNAAGNVTFIFNTLLGLIPGSSGTGVIVTIGFRAVGVGNSDVRLTNHVLLNTDLSEISATVTNASVTVRQNGGGQIPEPGSALVLCVPLAALLWWTRAGRRGGLPPGNAQ